VNNIEHLIKLYGSPLNLQELTETAFKYINKDVTQLLGLGFDIRYSLTVSNTHCYPKGGVTNWRSASDKPKSYPGWIGRIWHFYPDQKSSNSYAGLKGLGIHPGTGGYGWYNCPFKNVVVFKHKDCYPLSHDVRIFESDWLSLKLAPALNLEDKDKQRLFYIVGEPE
jgi:hypothetical protein